MSSVMDIVQLYHQLSAVDRLSFYLTLVNEVNLDKGSLREVQEGSRFAEGGKCLHCGSAHYVKNGRRSDGTQRYLCRDCGKSFLVSTNSVISGTHKSLGVWRKYFDCMMAAMTLKDTSAECGISMNTAFQWRHKILDSLQQIARQVCLGGTVEADETFFNVSYKGNHSGSRRFTMPRESHARGGDVHKKGLSSEKVCVMCAVNGDDVPVSKVGKLGKVSSECVKKSLSGHISPDATLVTDREKAYAGFSREHGIRLIQMDTDCRVKGEFNIQRVNAYHSGLKCFTDHFHGVSTKYLDNYLSWFNLIIKGVKGREEEEALLFGHVLAAGQRLRGCDLADRAPIPSVV